MNITPGKWLLHGWQGITFETPLDWELAAVHGDNKKGYLSLDDGRILRLELKWEPAKSSLDIAKTVSHHLAQLQRKAGKKAPPLKVQRNLKLARLRGKDYECFSVEDGLYSLNLLSRCQKCGQVILLSVLFDPDEDREKEDIFQRIVSSLRDHPSGGEIKWALYGLCFTLPEKAYLSENTLKAGSIELNFREAKGEISVARIGLAGTVLRRKKLDSWFYERYAKRLAAFRYDTERTKFRDHLALEVKGETPRFRGILPVIRSKEYLKALAWFCETMDKIYVFLTIGKDKESQTFERFSSAVECHS
jgi:hypothetical protein